MIASVAVEDIDGVDFIEIVLLCVSCKDAGHTWVETRSEQSGDACLLETLAVGPLP